MFTGTFHIKISIHKNRVCAAFNAQTAHTQFFQLINLSNTVMRRSEAINFGLKKIIYLKI